MARKQTSGRLNRFLDLIGLVDSDRDDTAQEAPARTTRASSGRRAAADDFDEFGDFDEPAPARTRRTNTATTRRTSRLNVENDEDEFGESQGWTNAAPGYSTRATRSRTAASTRTGAAGTARQTSSRTNSYRSQSGYSYSGERRSASSYRSASETMPRYRSEAPTSYTPAPARESAAYQPAPASTGYQRHQTIIFRLHSVDECKDVILSLIDKKSVLLNLDELDSVQAQRALDTMSGATYAIGATLSRASDRTWLITPSNVEVERSNLDEDGYSGGVYN